MGITIKELSERSGVKIPTIRYYERQGLLPEPERTATGQRRYGSVDVARLRFVRFSRRLGLEVGEIRALIEMVGEGNGEEIGVVTEAVAERAEQMWVLCSSLQSVSAAIITGAIDEVGAFDRLIGGEGVEIAVPVKAPFTLNQNAGGVAQSQSSQLIGATAVQEKASPAVELAADEIMEEAAREGDTPEAPCSKPKLKRARAKS